MMAPIESQGLRLLFHKTVVINTKKRPAKIFYK